MFLNVHDFNHKREASVAAVVTVYRHLTLMYVHFCMLRHFIPLKKTQVLKNFFDIRKIPLFWVYYLYLWRCIILSILLKTAEGQYLASG